MTTQEAQDAFDCAEPGSVESMQRLSALLQVKAQEHQAGIDKLRMPVLPVTTVVQDAPSRQTEMDF